MTRSDRPSGPSPDITPSEGYLRPGLVYIDDSELALQTLRRALYAEHILLDTYASFERFRVQHQQAVIGVLLDVDLGDGRSGLDVAHAMRSRHPRAAFAFYTANPLPERLEALNRVGPVFAKSDGVALAIAWCREVIAAANAHSRAIGR